MKSSLSKIQSKVDTSVSKIATMGGEFNFLRRTCKLEKDGLWIQPSKYIQQTLKVYEEQIGKMKLQQLPPQVLHEQDLFRSIVGSGIYLCSIRNEGVGFKNVKSNSYVISPLEEVPRILEEDFRLLSSS